MYRHYTKCFQHTPGAKPYNEKDLPGFILGISFPGLIISGLLAALLNPVAAGVVFGVQYAISIMVAADQWLFNRLACVDKENDPHCAIGTVTTRPEIGDLGVFDNDEYFDIRLMPHPALPHRDKPPPGVSQATFDQQVVAERQAYAKMVYADGFQGGLLEPKLDLPYMIEKNCYLHCEAEGSFWQAMKYFAIVLGAVAGAGAGIGAAVGAAAGCAALAWFFGPIGCAIGAIIGAIIGLFLGGAAGAAAGAAVAFYTTPGDVEDANVGDHALGPIALDDQVVVLGHLVYDGFHEGWHEFHPLMAVMKINHHPAAYLNAAPNFPNNPALSQPFGLTPGDMQLGLASPAFRAKAEALRTRWCRAIQDALSREVKLAQRGEALAWAAHPLIDGCKPPSEPQPIP
jgi:hypothetical protein